MMPPSSAAQMEPGKDQVETKTYCVKYENNNSKRWDGKTVMIDGEWLHSVCNTSNVHCGDKVKLPWTAKKGKIQYWNAVVVDGMENGSCKQPKNAVAADNTKSSPQSKKLKSRKTKGMEYNLLSCF